MTKLLQNRKIKIAAVIFLTAVIALTTIVIIVNKNMSEISLDAKVYQTDNGQVGICTNLASLSEKHIEYGDAIDFKFSTGYHAQFTPLLNGDFLNASLHVAKAMNSTDDIIFLIEDNTDTWRTVNLDESSTVHITLREKAKFMDLYQVSNMEITGDTKDLRSLRGGKLKFLDIFRGANPQNNEETRISSKHFFNALNIRNIINLDDNDKNVHQINIKNSNCNALIKEWLLKLVNNPSHAFIYSNKSDMTAYFCAIIECIAGSSYTEIVNDYMETYKNLYGITKEEKEYEYNTIKKYHIDNFLHWISKTTENYDMTNLDFGHVGEMYLRANGLKDNDIEKIKSRFIN